MSLSGEERKRLRELGKSLLLLVVRWLLERVVSNPGDKGDADKGRG